LHYDGTRSLFGNGRERRLNLVKRSDHCHRSNFNAGGETGKLDLLQDRPREWIDRVG
jgi:hypothetical protein